jgi:hypothetical protein
VDNISEDKTGKKDEYGRTPLGDFVPVNVAIRLKEAITFSLDLDLRNPAIEFDEKTLDMIDEWNFEQEKKAQKKA